MSEWVIETEDSALYSVYAFRRMVQGCREFVQVAQDS